MRAQAQRVAASSSKNRLVLAELAALFESIAGRAWLEHALAKAPGHRLLLHPLVSGWLLAKRIVENGGRFGGMGAPKDHLMPLARIVLDSGATRLVREELGEENYLFRRLATTFRDAQQFADTMVEISAAAWCISRKIAIAPCEGEALPEFTIKHESEPRRIFVECKQISGWNVSPDQLSRKLKLGNRKLDSLPCEDRGPLLLILDLSNHVGLASASLDPPEQIGRCAAIVADQLARKRYRNLSAIGLMWHNLAIGRANAAGEGGFAFQRVSHWLSHPHARRSMQVNPLEGYAFTVELKFNGAVKNRNDPCYCGSERRFKHCHGRLT